MSSNKNQNNDLKPFLRKLAYDAFYDGETLKHIKLSAKDNLRLAEKYLGKEAQHIAASDFYKSYLLDLSGHISLWSRNWPPHHLDLKYCFKLVDVAFETAKRHRLLPEEIKPKAIELIQYHNFLNNSELFMLGLHLIEKARFSKKEVEKVLVPKEKS
jgi:hypothetical protein